MRLQLGLALTLFAGTTHAQSTFGSIAGSVRDASGAAVAGVGLRLRNLDENTAVSAKSGPLGLYEFLNVKPARYEVSAEHSGFSVGKTPEFTLAARETRRADFTLEIAPRVESTVVTSTVPRIDTGNGTISDSKDFEQVTRLPINVRASNTSPFAAILTVPGVQVETAGRMSIGGGLPAHIEFSVDGISTINVASHFNNDNLAPSTEMVQEFRVTSVNAGAESGPLADVTLISRSGTNQFHGSTFWYHQNRELDATVYGAARKQQKTFNDFGLSLGGPLRIPFIYQGSGRTFFFADFEGNRRPQTKLVQQLYPAGAARQGDLFAAAGGAAVDPSNGAPFPGNRIPAARINPVAARLLDHYYPLPNVTAQGAAYNYLDLAPGVFTSNGYDVRLDHVIDSAQRVFARWSAKGQDSFNFFSPLPSSTSRNEYSSLVVAHTWAPSAHLANELRFGLGVWHSRENFPIRGRDAVSDLGLAGLNLQNAGDTGGFPYFDFSDSTGYATTYHGRSSIGQSTSYQFTETLSWTRGRHIAKFGADIRKVGYAGTLHYGNGSDDFGGFYFSRRGFSGNAFADLLLGIPAQSYYAFVGPDVSESSLHAGFFLRDTWRISPRLTLDFGLRWEVHPPFVEAAGNITNFDHRTGDVIVPDRTLPAAPGFLAAINACPVAPEGTPCTKILTASQAGLPQGLRTTDYSDWNPRLGIAWQPWGGGKTVIRAGAGIYTETLLGQTANGPAGVHSSDVRDIDNSLDNNRLPLFTLPNILPGPNALGAVGRETFLMGSDTHLRDPRSYQWNFTIERELPWLIAMRASYIGLQSVGMPVRVNLNQVPVSAQRYSEDRLPFQHWGYFASIENVAFAKYHGLQLQAARQVSRGVYFQATWVYSKNLGAIGATGANAAFPPEVYQFAPTDRFNTRYDRGNLPAARRSRFLLTALVPLPFGKGRTFGANWRGMRQTALGGWELSTVTLVQSGPFLTATMSGGLDQSNSNVPGRFAQARPDRIGNGNLDNPTRDRFFDLSAFAPPPQGAARLGNSGAGILAGPGTVAVAAGLAKTFPVTERARLRLEATFTNLPNHPNFLPPVTNISNPIQFGRIITAQFAENSGNRTGQVGVRLDF